MHKKILGFILASLALAQSLMAQDSAAEKITALQGQVAALPLDSTPEKFKKATLTLALEQIQGALAVQDSAYASGLIHDVATALPLKPGSTGIAADKLSFLPPLKQADSNPYLDALYQWTENQLSHPDLPWKHATADTRVYLGTDRDYGTREEAINMMSLIWLVAHPQSKYQGNPELFTRLMRRAHAYVEDYALHAETYQDHLNDFFALGPALYDLQVITQLWPDAILSSQKVRWDATVRKAADFWLKVYQDNKDKGYSRMGKYTNRDLGMANILLNAGLYLHDQNCLDVAQSLIDAQEASLYPDGGFAYIGKQNESCGYHDADISLLTRYYLVSGNAKAGELLTRSQWYGPLSLEPGMVAEFSTTPCWKHTWNGSYSTGKEVVASLSQNPYLRSLLDLELKLKGANPAKPDLLNVMFYQATIAPKPLPDNYTVLDRNLVGVRGRYGKFSFALTTRPTPADEPGKDTLVGALTLDDNTPQEPYPLNAALMKAMPQVDPTGNPRDMAYCTRDEIASVITGKNFSAVSSHYGLQAFGSSQRGKDVPWVVNQEWLTLKDHLFCLMEVAPQQGTVQASGVSTHFLLGTGGTMGGPPQELVVQDDHHYTYGNLALSLGDHNYTTIQHITTKVRTSTGVEIILQDSAPDATAVPLKTYSSDQPFYCLAEISPVAPTGTQAVPAQRLTQPGGILGLRVKQEGKLFTLWHNPTDQSATLDLQDSAKMNSSLQLSQENHSLIQSPAPSSYSLPAHQAVLLVTSPEAPDHEAGWASYAAMVGM